MRQTCGCSQHSLERHSCHDARPGRFASAHNEADRADAPGPRRIDRDCAGRRTLLIEQDGPLVIEIVDAGIDLPVVGLEPKLQNPMTTTLIADDGRLLRKALARLLAGRTQLVFVTA